MPMKDEGNHQGAVDESFSEQWICIVDANYILYEKNWTCTHSGTGSYGRQAGGRQVADEIHVKSEIFKNCCTSKDSTFCFVQPRYSIITAVEMHFRCFFG